MSDSFDIEIRGLAELDKKLSELDNAVAGKALFSALSAGLTPMVKAAKQKAAIAPEPHTMTVKGGRKVVVQQGLLKSSIRKRRLPKSEHKGEFAQGAVMGIYIGKGTKQKEFPNYWHFIEYGTAKMPKIPFLRPAFDNNVDKAIDRFAKKLAKNIDKLGSK